jgi:hypothetical protein
MKLTLRDGIATLLVAAILVPYFGYLINGEMPFIEDPRGMSAVGLLLGVAAFLIAGRISTATTVGKVVLGVALVGLAVGIAALALAETAAAEVLLATFIAAIVVAWAVQMLHHAGLLHIGSGPTALRRS